jgi:hypothetical protein
MSFSGLKHNHKNQTQLHLPAKCIYSMFIFLLQQNIKIPQTYTVYFSSNALPFLAQGSHNISLCAAQLMEESWL